MPDRSTTHAAHLDDSMAADTESLTRGAPVESRTHEDRMAEPPDDDSEVEAIIAFAADPVPGSLGEDERRRRSELAIALRPHAFPSERDELLRVAEHEHAPDWVLVALEQLPINTRFDTPQDVWIALGGHREIREPGPAGHQARVAPPPGPPASAPVASRVASAASTGVWHEVGCIGLRAARLPFVVIERGARAVLDILPRP